MWGMISTDYPYGPQFPILNIDTDLCRAQISLYGAHLLSWQPKGQRPVIFLSPKVIFKQGKALRGGIPLCWPWFGKHPQDADKPSHGIARISTWDLSRQEEEPDGTVKLLLTLPPKTSDTPSGALAIQIGSELHMSLMTLDVPQTMPFSAALHTYFEVSDYEKVAVTGLEEAPFVEYAADAVPHSEDPLIPAGSIDRIYHPVPENQEISIHDPAWKRSIRISRSGSASCVVWNPGVAQAETMGDLGGEAARHFLAVETAAVPAENLLLRCGETHELALSVEVIPVE